jgi:hypothetical protein
MMNPYGEALLRFTREHPDFVHDSDGDGKHLALIVETRPSFWLPLVLRNVMYFLGPRWRLCVVCSLQAEFFLRSHTRDWKMQIINTLPNGLLKRPLYNQLILNGGFWMQFREEKVLMFQTDSLLCRDGVEDYLHYDFIGAPCGDLDGDFVYNGGLSIRNRQMMMDILAEHGEVQGTDIAEDVFFTEQFRKRGARLPDLLTASEFSVESVYRRHPFAVHGTDKYYHNLDTAMRIAAGIRY